MLLATEVTNWPERLALTGLTIGFALAMFALMRNGWKRKLEIQSEVLPPAEIPNDFQPLRSYPGRYLASTAAGAWLTRIVVHELGVPSRMKLEIGEAGIAVQREGARSFYIPNSAILATRSDRAIAGKAYESDGIAVLTWALGEIEVDSGFRFDSITEQIGFLSEKLGGEDE